MTMHNQVFKTGSFLRSVDLADLDLRTLSRLHREATEQGDGYAQIARDPTGYVWIYQVLNEKIINRLDPTDRGTFLDVSLLQQAIKARIREKTLDDYILAVFGAVIDDRNHPLPDPDLDEVTPWEDRPYAKMELAKVPRTLRNRVLTGVDGRLLSAVGAI